MIDIILVIAIVAGALVAFASEKIRADLVALLIMALLTVLGTFRPDFPTVDEGISGFSNKATVTIAAMFILSAGLVKTGAINWVTGRILHFGSNSEARLFVLLMLAVGTVSAFINNAAAVAVFIPISLTIARRQKLSPSKILLPISFASIVGGTCTLIGTSTNILVSSMAADRGLGEFSMFELSKLGIIFFGVGMAYLFFYARRSLPERVGTRGLVQEYRLGNYLTSVVVNRKSSLISLTPVQARIGEKYDVHILEVFRKSCRISTGIRDTHLQEGDVLLVQGSLQNILEMNSFEGLSIRSEVKYGSEQEEEDEPLLVEAIVAPGSGLEGRTLRDVNFRKQFRVFVLAIRKQGEVIRDHLGLIKLQAGDSLLLQGAKGFLRGSGQESRLPGHRREVPAARSRKSGDLCLCDRGWRRGGGRHGHRSDPGECRCRLHLDGADRLYFSAGRLRFHRLVRHLPPGWSDPSRDRHGEDRNRGVRCRVAAGIDRHPRHRGDHPCFLPLGDILRRHHVAQCRGHPAGSDRHRLGPGSGREPDALSDGHHLCSLVFPFHSLRLPHEPDGLRAGRIQVRRLSQNRNPPQHPPLDRRQPGDSVYLAAIVREVCSRNP